MSIIVNCKKQPSFNHPPLSKKNHSCKLQNCLFNGLMEVLLMCWIWSDDMDFKIEKHILHKVT
jgi:hypothetical protein